MLSKHSPLCKLQDASGCVRTQMVQVRWHGVCAPSEVQTVGEPHGRLILEALSHLHEADAALVHGDLQP